DRAGVIHRDLEHDQPDEVSLRPYIDSVWRYRRVILGAVAASVAVFGVVAITVYLLAPVETTASLHFRLLFEGADKHEYPNKTPFSPMEVISAPVFRQVYAANELQRYGSYEAFKESMFVLGANPAVDLLTYEYQSKLADTRLTPVDRARIEDEFRRKSEALTDPIFSLNLRQHNRFTVLPRSLTEKILHDTLATWARFAVDRKGATRYDVPILSSNILPRAVIDREDYLIAIDIIRAKAERVIETINKLSQLPGAQVIRTDKEQLSLADIRANLEDVGRFKLEPPLELVRSEGVTRNARELALYANNQLFQLRQRRNTSQSLVKALEDSLGRYTAPRATQAAEAAASGGGGGSGPAVFQL